MKKCLALFSSLMMLSAAAFADISAKQLDDGNVEVTFFYGNPRATEVKVAGDFTNWADGAIAMTKGEKGFSLTQVFPAGTVLKYKFIADENWTEDMRAPDKVDDGFGGHNALADLDVLVESSASSDGSSSAAGNGNVSKKPRPSIKFQTWSMVGFQNKWNISDYKEGNTEKKAGEDSSGIGAKSYWKFSGNVTPHVPVYVEVALCENDGFNNLYNRDVLQLKDGTREVGTDLAFDPLYMLNSNASEAEKTYLGHFKTGVEFPWVKYTTGYKYAKLPPHSNVNWTTIDNEWEAGYSATGGYTQWETGDKVKESLANATNGAVSDFNAVFAPNRTADRAGNQYGLYAYANANLFDNHYVDFQYNGAYGKEFDKVFDRVFENDYILGYKGKIGPVVVKANGLLNTYGNYLDEEKDKVSLYSPSSSDVGAVDPFVDNKIDDTAANVNVYYENDLLDATVGFRYRGNQASMMYVEQGADDHDHITDNLGDRNRWRGWFDVHVFPTDMFSIGVNPYIEKTLNKDSTSSFADKDNTLVYVKPYGDVILDDDTKINFYAETKYNTKDADHLARGGREAKAFVIEEAGVRFETKLDGLLNSLAVMYGYDANETSVDLHTLIVDMGLPLGINAQVGAGFRTVDNSAADDNPFGFFLGMNKQVCKSYNTVFYTNFVYGVDPYKAFGDGQDTLNLDGYTLDSDADYFWHNAALRMGLKFDF